MAFFSLGCCCASTDKPQFSAVAMWRAEMNAEEQLEHGLVYGEEQSQHGRQQEGAGSQTAAAATTAKQAVLAREQRKGLDTEGAWS